MTSILPPNRPEWCARVLTAAVAALAITLGAGAQITNVLAPDADITPQRVGNGGVAADTMRTVEVFAEVQRADGTPVDGAVVVTSAGGQGVTDLEGIAIFTIEVSPAAERVQVTAVASMQGQNYRGSVEAPLIASAVGAAANWCDAGVIILAAGGTCEPEWVPTFGGQPGANNVINSFAVFDDGTGSALFVGGAFETIAGVAASRIARWDGRSWSPLGGGIDGQVHELEVFDDGSGPTLFVGGKFETAGGVETKNIARWNGTTWSAVGNGIADSRYRVAALAGFDCNDGFGPALYAGGSFPSAGGMEANRIARWDGTRWSPVGDGLNDHVGALAVFDDQSLDGPSLYVGGRFTTAGGIPAIGIARWDGFSWTSVGGGIGGIFPTAFSLITFDDGLGDGPALYAGGSFSMAGGITAGQIAKWDGSDWFAVGEGMTGSVSDLTVFDDGTGTGPQLYAGGQFRPRGSSMLDKVARWDGIAWSPVGHGIDNGVRALGVFDDESGRGPLLVAGGDFKTVSGATPAQRIAKWDGSKWSAIADGIDSRVRALTTYNDGSGAKLYLGGDFTNIDGISVRGLAAWNGSTLTDVGGGVLGSSREVHALVTFDDGRGPALFVGGRFSGASGIVSRNIVRWDGTEWSKLTNGTNAAVTALAVFNDGSAGGPALFVAGFFSLAGSKNIRHLAKWDGTDWFAVAQGVNRDIDTMVVFDDGNGPALFLGGLFSAIGAESVNLIARWNGLQWSSLGRGISGSSPRVRAIGLFQDGSTARPSLYVGGNFEIAGRRRVRNIARWDGSSWFDVGEGVDGLISAFEVFDDGTGDGPALYVAGQFNMAGNIAVNNIAKWDGVTWKGLNGGIGGAIPIVSTFTAISDNSELGPALFLGGAFATSPVGDSFLARYQGCPINNPPSCPSPPPVTSIWPPDHDYVEIDIAPLAGVTDPDGDAVTIEVTAILQNQPVNDDDGDGNTSCDGVILGGSLVKLRVESDDDDDDQRIYRVEYTASDDCGLACDGAVEIHIADDDHEEEEDDDDDDDDDDDLPGTPQWVDATVCLPDEDLDGDDDIDLGDLFIVLKTFGQSGPGLLLSWPDGDVNHDGAVTFDDLLMVISAMMVPAQPRVAPESALTTD